MKFFNYYDNGAARLGIFLDGRYFAANEKLVTDDIVAGRVSADGITAGAELAKGSFRFAPSVIKPDKILCAGLNYRDHAEETGGKAPEKPVFFDKLR